MLKKISIFNQIFKILQKLAIQSLIELHDDMSFLKINLKKQMTREILDFCAYKMIKILDDHVLECNILFH